MPVTMFHCRACGSMESTYIAIKATVDIDHMRLEMIRMQLNGAGSIPVDLVDDGVRQMPLNAPVYQFEDDHEPIAYKVDPDTGPFLRACVNCGTVRMMPRDER